MRTNRLRLAVCLALGALLATRTYGVGRVQDPTDFGQVWFAARAVLHGTDPYPLVGPGRAFSIPFVLVYPLSAPVSVLPLGLLSVRVACAVFFGFGAAAFAWALTRRSYVPLLGMLSASTVFAAEEAQWSPLLAAAAALPPLGVFFAAKPTVGAAIFAARPSWWPIVGGGAILALSLLLQPHWPAAWLHALALTPPTPGAPAPYLAPIHLRFGVLTLLALLRWRRPEARLVAALACVPQTGLLYETVPLFLVPETIRETVALTAASYGVLWWVAHQPTQDYAAHLAVSGQAITIALYLPCVLMVLRRPNEGTVPAWLDARLNSARRYLNLRARF